MLRYIRSTKLGTGIRFATKMNAIIMIFTGAICIYPAHSQTTRYIHRFRNFSIASETDSMYMLSMNIYRHNEEHFLSVKANATKDVKVKSLQIQLFRCVYEKSACENFQKWTFNKNMNRFVHMKNQIWSPAIQSIVPKLDFPLFRKGIYEGKNISFDATAALLFYPEAMNYYFQTEIMLIDHNDKKAVSVCSESAFLSFVKKDRNCNRGYAGTKS